MVLIIIASIVGAIIVTAVVGGSIVKNVVETSDARSDALCKKKEPYEWAIEDDDVKRKCTVQCYKRNVYGLNSHWALTFNWGNYTATYEAGNDRGYLIPRWRKGNREFYSPSRKPYEWEASVNFDINCSPRTVNDMARAIPYNGAKYVLTKINGHLWTEHLARDFGFKHWKLSASDEMFIPLPIASILDNSTFLKIL